MGWEKNLGMVALGVVRILLKRGINSSVSDVSPSRDERTQSAQKPPGTSPVFRQERAIFDEFVSSNAERPLGECKDELLVLINSCVKKAYYTGGEDMREGLIEEVRRAGY